MESTSSNVIESTGTARAVLGPLEARFVDNWAGLAAAFGMDANLGRIHARLYLASGPPSVEELSESLDLERAECAAHVATLISFGVVKEEPSDHYEAERDPWSWFLRTVRERGKREFSPILIAVRDLQEQAGRVRSSLGPNGDSDDVARLDRIIRFNKFIDQLAGFVETFSSFGAGPMMRAMKMVTRFLPNS